MRTNPKCRYDPKCNWGYGFCHFVLFGLTKGVCDTSAQGGSALGLVVAPPAPACAVADAVALPHASMATASPRWDSASATLDGWAQRAMWPPCAQVDAARAARAICFRVHPCAIVLALSMGPAVASTAFPPQVVHPVSMVAPASLENACALLLGAATRVRFHSVQDTRLRPTHPIASDMARATAACVHAARDTAARIAPLEAPAHLNLI